MNEHAGVKHCINRMKKKGIILASFLPISFALQLFYLLEGTLWVKVLVMEDNGTPVSASCLDKARQVNVSLSRCVTSRHFHVHVGRMWHLCNV